MPKAKTQIQFPQANAQIGFEDEAKKRFDKIDNLLIAVVAGVVISGIAVVISVVGIFLDQLRYNNAAYRDYSQKVQSVSDYQSVNKSLLDQNDKNQKIIIEQQKEIQKLLNK